jgi:hypothetical protein
MTQSFFKKDQPSPHDKEKLESLLLILEKISLQATKSKPVKADIKEAIAIAQETIMDLSFETPYMTKQHLLEDIHNLRSMAEKSDLSPLISYIESMQRLIVASINI